MTTYTTDLVSGLLPDDVNVPESFIQTLNEASVALQVSTVVTPDDPSHLLRLPLITQDPVAAWVAEGAEIEASDAEFDEVTATYHKLAALTPHTREAIRDASPQVLDMILAGIARNIAKQIDAAYFGTAGASANVPPGLGDLTVAEYATAETGWDNLDPFTLARMNAAALGSSITSWVTSPATAAALSLIREAEGSNRGLLQPDPTAPQRSLIGGFPLLVTPAVEADTVWGIPQATSYVVVRQDVELEANESVYFTSDRVAVRGTARVGFAHTQPDGIAKVTTTLDAG